MLKECKSDKKIAIIGAGWMGIGCLTVLKECGYQVDVYEKNNDVGGVWHPINNYANLKCHNPANTVEFYDYLLPDHIDKTQRITSAQIFLYLQNYVKAKNLAKHFYFSHQVDTLDYHSKDQIFLLSVLDSQQQKIQKKYDYIIYTNGFSNRHLPDFTDSKVYAGELIHSFDATKERLNGYMAQDKKITVIGGSKTATDLIIYFFNHGYMVNWLYREPYWFFKYPNKTRLSETSLSKKIFKGLFNRINSLVMNYHKNEKVLYLLFHTLRLLHTFGAKKSFDLKRFHSATITKEEMNILKRYNQKHGVKGEILKFEPEGIRLTDHRFLKSDIVICCTGSGPNGQEINIKKDGQEYSISKVRDVYRARVIPYIPRLIFTGYHSFTTGVVNSLVQGLWIDKYIEENWSVAHLEANTAHYDYNFFEQVPLFSSQKILADSYYFGIEQFIEGGEINKDKFKDWLVECYTNTGVACKPFEFSK